MTAFDKAAVGLFHWLSANAARSGDPRMVLSASRFDVAETARRIERDAPSRGLRVLDRTDHAALAGREGYRLLPTQTLVVGSPAPGVPLRLVVWQARTGVTLVSLDQAPRNDPRRLETTLPKLLRGLAPPPAATLS